MINPTTTFPRTTKSPKALIIAPDSPPLVRMFLVVETLIPSRKRVVIKSREGKIDSSRGSRIVMVITRIIMEIAILITIATSTRAGGNGIIKSNMITSTKSTTEFCKSRLSIPIIFLCFL